MEIAVPRSTVAILVLLAVCVFVPPIQATKISYCNRKADYAVKVTDVVISPDPIKKGKPTTFEIHASTAQPLAGGNMNLDVSYFGVHVHSESDDVCEKSSCPIQPGNFVLSHTQTLPGITPPGTYTLKMKMVDEKETELTCISFQFKIALGDSSSVASI